MHHQIGSSRCQSYSGTATSLDAAYAAKATQVHNQLLATPGSSSFVVATPATLASQPLGVGNFGNGGSAASHSRELFPESKKGGSSPFLSEIPKRANFSFDAPARSPLCQRLLRCWTQQRCDSAISSSSSTRHSHSHVLPFLQLRHDSALHRVTGRALTPRENS